MSQPAPSEKQKPRRSIGLRLNLGLLRIARNWLKIVLVLVGLYACLPYAAPTLMRLGLSGPANIIYTIYSPMCHQFAFRSVFLFGEQPFYPRHNTNSSLTPFETYVADLDDFNPERILPIWGRVGDIYGFTGGFQGASREFIGTDAMGFKMAVCARDAAIYLALFTGGLIYAIPAVRRRLRPIPFWLYIFAGLGPIGLDGFSQLLSYPPFELWPVRETAPFFRVATGAMFGLMSAWLAYPNLEISMTDLRLDIEYKLAQRRIRP